jgi:hypothetical protein
VSAQVLSDALWAGLAACVVAVVLASHLSRFRLERLTTLVRRFEENRAGYIVMLLGWMWVGWHFFAR